MIWKRYESHFKIAADDPFLEEILESGSLEIYQILKGHGCPVGGKEGYSSIDWAAKHGWIDVLRENRSDINVDGRLLKIICHQADTKMRDCIFDLLLEDPQKIDVCKIISEKTVSLAVLCGTLNEKLFDEILSCSMTLSKWDTIDLKELLAKNFHSLFKDSYKAFQQASEEMLSERSCT